MKRTFEAATLQTALYLKTGRAVMPVLAMVIYLVTFYSVGPADIVSSSTLTAMVLCFVSAWTALSFARAEEPAIAQLIQLKLDSPLREALSGVLPPLLCGAAAAAATAAWPLLRNLADGGGHFFTRAVSAGDALAMAALFYSFSILGGAYGSLFHCRLIRDTRAAWLLAIAGCLAGAFSGMISARIPAFSGVSWLFPPVYGLITRFEKAPALGGAALSRTLAECWLYAAAAFTARAALLRRVRY
jgi:hypothetical protein